MEINLPLDKAIGGTTAALISGLLIAAYGKSAAKSTLNIAKTLVCALVRVCFKTIPAKLWYQKKILLTATGISLLPHALIIAYWGTSMYTEIIKSEFVCDLPIGFKLIFILIAVSIAILILTMIYIFTEGLNEF